MPTFTLKCVNPETSEEKTLLYTTETSALTDENYVSVVQLIDAVAPKEKKRGIGIGKGDIKVLKIQLGLSCNFSCEYCNQRFVPHAEETHQEEAAAFMAGLDGWLKDVPEQIEFWGGEPFVYWKTLKPLAEALRLKFPNTPFSIITNGSILDDAKVDWLVDLGFAVSISHDGPGQSVRGPDPLEDPEVKAAILKLYNMLAPQRRFSFNSMMNRQNTSRAAIQKFFEDLVAPNVRYLVIGEGAFVDAYDEGGLSQSLQTNAEQVAYRQKTFAEIRSGMATRFNGAVTERTMSFVNSFRVGRSIDTVGQKCGMERRESLAVDLNGNVLTCQNVSPVAVNPSGVSHKIGHVSDLEAVRLNTATHWTDRAECPSCPVIHICKGSCFFLTGPLWESSCNNAFSDAIPIFAAGIEFLTGYVPVRIDGPLREDRKDIFKASPDAKKPFPIPVVSA